MSSSEILSPEFGLGGGGKDKERERDKTHARGNDEKSTKRDHFSRKQW